MTKAEESERREMADRFTPDEMRAMAEQHEAIARTEREEAVLQRRIERDGAARFLDSLAEDSERVAAMLRYAADTLQQRDETCESASRDGSSGSDASRAREGQTSEKAERDAFIAGYIAAKGGDKDGVHTPEAAHAWALWASWGDLPVVKEAQPSEPTGLRAQVVSAHALLAEILGLIDPEQRGDLVDRINAELMPCDEAGRCPAAPREDAGLRQKVERVRSVLREGNPFIYEWAVRLLDDALLTPSSSATEDARQP